MEIWKDISGFEGHYQVSNYGRIISYPHPKTNKGRVLKPFPNPNGYLWVCLHKDKKEARRQVHRIVMEAFRGKSNLVVNHKDLNPKNNFLCNLEYCTHAQNIQHAHDNGAVNIPKGEKCHLSKLSNKQRDEIVELRKTLSAREIAEKFNLSIVHTQRIAREWKGNAFHPNKTKLSR